jgi:hypothetical protein
MFKLVIVQFDFDVPEDFTFKNIEEKSMFISNLILNKDEYNEQGLQIIPKVPLIQIDTNIIVKICDRSIQHNYQSILVNKLTSLSLKLGKKLLKQ